MKLRELRKQKNLSMKELAKIFNLSESTISLYERGLHEPEIDTLKKFATYFGVSTDYLLGNEIAANAATPETEEVIFMPVIAKITAGFGKNAEMEYNGEKLPIPKYMIRGNVSDYFILQVQGDSMYPNYLNGDNVLMEKADFADSGQIVAVCIGEEEATLKRIEYDTPRTYIKLIPLNPNYPPRTFTDEDMNTVRIIGISKYLIRRT